MTCGKRTVSRVFESCTHQHTLSSAQLNVLSSVDNDDDSDDEFGNLRENEPWDESLCFASLSEAQKYMYVHIHTLLNCAASHCHSYSGLRCSGSLIASLPSSSTSSLYCYHHYCRSFRLETICLPYLLGP